VGTLIGWWWWQFIFYSKSFTARLYMSTSIEALIKHYLSQHARKPQQERLVVKITTISRTRFKIQVEQGLRPNLARNPQAYWVQWAPAEITAVAATQLNLCNYKQNINSKVGGSISVSVILCLALNRIYKYMYDQQHVTLYTYSCNVLDIRAVQSTKCIVWCAADCTHIPLTLYPQKVSRDNYLYKW
jgi:hypothetical protein